MILILAEKPSLGRNIAAAIGPMQKRDGYLEGGGYLISWAFGHLFSLCDIERYTGDESGRWRMEGLPCFPDTFQFELRRDRNTKAVDPGVKKQFETIRTLCNRPDVDTIVNAGDADREGEIIIRLVIRHALTTEKPILRLWLPDQTPETVTEALRTMKPDADYDRLAGEGFARTYIDWLYGVNLTRYATLRTGTLLRVGRVIVPIVRAIYERDQAIRRFVPGKYLCAVSREETGGEVVELIGKKRFAESERADAEALCRRYNEQGATVTAVKRKKDTLSPGKLFSLSKLQNVLGKKYKMSMQESLDTVQKLYEMGYLTYPRTNSEYLATAEKEKIRQILSLIGKMGYPVAMREDKAVFDDAKIESHSALTPTYKIPEKNALTDAQQKVYATVFRRFVAVFCAEKCVVSKTEITVSVGDLESFVLKGTVVLEPGWTRYDDRAGKDKFLPKLEKNDRVAVCFSTAEKETSPPRHYTIETLNNYLKNPFREEKTGAKGAPETDATAKTDDDEEYRAAFEGLELGTEATRTGIIDNARASHYIQLTKDVYTIQPAGEFLVESLDRLGIRMDKYQTVELGKSLKQVFRGTATVEDSVRLAEAQIRALFGSLDANSDPGFFGDEAGACPLCGKPVVRGRTMFGCSGYQETGCRFSVNTVICGKTIPLAAVKTLLATGKTPLLQGFVSPKTGKSFDAALMLSDGKAVFSFDRSEAPAARRPACPLCGKPVIRGKTAFGRGGRHEGCALRLPFRWGEVPITDRMAAELLSGHPVTLPDGTVLHLDHAGTLVSSANA